MVLFKKSKKGKELLFLLVFLLPLLFINVRESHDWGGDFALYIKQGMNIIQGKPQGDNGYIFNENFPYLAPPTYSVGFPLLLAPVYACFGNSILHFSIFISCLLITTLITMYLFLRRYYSTVISFIAVLVIAYNPWLLSFKCEILSDIPFTLFFTLSLLVYLSTDWDQKKYGTALLLGLLCGYALLIKSIGIVLLAAFCLDSVSVIYSQYKNGKVYVRLKNMLSILAAALGVYILLSKVLFPGKEDSYSFFSTLFVWENIGDVMLTTSYYYTQVFQEFFRPNAGQWNFAPLIVTAFALAFFLLGLLLKLMQQRSVIDYVVLFYLAVVICFPNTSQGFRYLFPLCAIYFYYIIYAVQSIRLERKVSSAWIASFIGIAILLTYKHAVKELIEGQHATLMGPQEPESQEVFEYIRQHVPPDQVLAFIKPTVSALYAERNSIGYRWDQDSLSMDKKFGEVRVHYLLTSTDMKAQSMDEYLNRHKASVDTLFTNGKFQLYYKK